MQKALNEMNIQLHHVISNITGVTGMNDTGLKNQGQKNNNLFPIFAFFKLQFVHNFV